MLSSAKRTAENQAGIHEKPSISAVRYTDCLINLDLIPALKVLGYFHIVRSADVTPFTLFWAKLAQKRLNSMWTLASLPLTRC